MVTINIHRPVIRLDGNLAINPIIPTIRLTTARIDDAMVVRRACCRELGSFIFGCGSSILSISPLVVSFFISDDIRVSLTSKYEQERYI